MARRRQPLRGSPKVDGSWGIGTRCPAAPEFLSTSVPYATLDCNGGSHRANPLRSTKAPYQRVIWAIRVKVGGEKRVWEDPKHCTKWCGRLILSAPGRGNHTEAGSSQAGQSFQRVLSRYRRSGRVQTRAYRSGGYAAWGSSSSAIGKSGYQRRK